MTHIDDAQVNSFLSIVGRASHQIFFFGELQQLAPEFIGVLDFTKNRF